LTASEKDDLIVRLLSAEEHPSHLLAPLRQRFQKQWSRTNRSSSPAAAQPRRTAAQLFEAGKVLAEESRRRDAQRRARAAAKRQRTEAAERKRYLEELAPKAETIWRKVESLLQTTIPRDYDQAVKWLGDLRDLAQTSLPSDTKTWEERLRGLRRQHARKRNLLKRFDEAGFPR
jgi:hypothetical protein